MDKIEGKIKYKYLRNSKFEKARLMAGKDTKYEYKYLTQAQIDQLYRYGMFHLVQPLTRKDNYIISKFKDKPIKSNPIRVKYKDEDEFQISEEFKSLTEAQNWI